MKVEDKIALKKYQQKLKLIRSSGGAVDANETKEDQKARIARAKKDVRFLVEHYFPHYATSKSAKFQIDIAVFILKTFGARVFLQWGRGLAKSVWANVIIPFWLWINDEAHYMVIVTTSKDRAEELLDDLKAEFEINERIINDFGEQKNLGQWEKGFFVTKGGFIAKALGAGQSVRGLRVKAQRPDYIVVDDLETKETIANPKRQKKLANWIERDLIPTMDGKIKRFVYANNRFAPVMIQTLLQDKHPKWKVHEINAYDPTNFKPTWSEKYDDDYYEDVEEDLGTLAAQAEFNNKPHIEGEIFKEEQIQWAKLPRIDHFKIIVGHWDVAYAGTQTSDFNAVKVWGLKDTDFFQIDCFVKQTKMRAAVDWMCYFQKQLPANVIVHWRFEAQFWNDEVERTIEESEIDNNEVLNIIKIQVPKGISKYDRMLRMQSYYQNGRIYYNEKKKSHQDTNTGLAQLYGIEPGYKTKDDSPDGDEHCISELSKYIVKGRRSGKIKTGKHERKTRF